MEALLAALPWLDYGAVLVFGAAGALAAARQGRDIVTFVFFAAVAGVGGGTLRDVLIDAPVFWVQRPDYLLLSLAGAAAVWLFGPGKGGRMTLLLWLDSLGMAAYCVVGAAKALSLGVHPVPAAVMGVLTATFGGIVRDILAHEPNVLLRKEIYVTPAMLGSGLFTALSVAHVPFWPSALAGFAVAFAVRGLALQFGWSLPGFRKGLFEKADPPAT
ncbi:MAG: trimeric intracellular cation channel family protein [Caulobacterales bacterium]|nr:trimeric intracellular cation channel family protein [Caulobacterales bacterium]